MNRRKALKIGGILSFTGLASFFSYKYHFRGVIPQNSYFTEQETLLSELVECMIPKTDTPGAKEAHVHLFVIRVLQNCAHEVEKINFFKGMEELKSYCQSRYGKDFLHCSKTEKNELMLYFEAKDRPFHGMAGKIQKRIFGESFFSILKKHTVNGYCISFLGATKNLRYDAIPGVYESCIAYHKGGPSWATD